MKVWLVVVVIVVNSLVEIVCSDSMLLGDFQSTPAVYLISLPTIRYTSQH